MKLRYYSKKTNRRILIGAAALLVAGGATTYFAFRAGTESSSSPEYTTVTPEGGNVAWEKISPPSSESVFAYIDRIDGITIQISQQPLPTSFQSDTDTKIAEFARNFNATTKLETDGALAYIGTSSQGPQSVIFTKNGLLILIRSQEEISSSSWRSYIESLE